MSIFSKLFSGLFRNKSTEEPYINPNRDMNEWNKRIEMFPDMAVSPDMMIRNEDGLLPGHVYQLYWMDKYNSQRRIPAYFEYKYGIDFYEGKKLLESKGLIKNWSITNLGNEIINKYQRIIDTHQNEHLEKYKVDRKAEIKRFRQDVSNAKKAGIETNKTVEEHLGYLDQLEGIGFYKNKDFEKAEKYLLMAFDNGFSSPACTDYLAKIYRKRKDYQSEVKALERGIKIQIDNFNKETKNGKNLTHENQKVYFEKSLDKNTERLEKAKVLLNKQKDIGDD